MQVEATPTTDFVHGQLRARQGRPQMIEQGLAQDLEAQGLLRIKNVLAGPLAAAKKASAAGMAPPSSASPAAPASPTQTASASVHGATSVHGAKGHRRGG